MGISNPRVGDLIIDVEEGRLEVRPYFQRREVWTNRSALPRVIGVPEVEEENSLWIKNILDSVHHVADGLDVPFHGLFDSDLAIDTVVSLPIVRRRCDNACVVISGQPAKDLSCVATVHVPVFPGRRIAP